MNELCHNKFSKITISQSASVVSGLPTLFRFIIALLALIPRRQKHASSTHIKGGSDKGSSSHCSRIPDVQCNLEGTHTLLQPEYDRVHNDRMLEFSREWKENVLNSIE